MYKLIGVGVTLLFAAILGLSTSDVLENDEIAILRSVGGEISVRTDPGWFFAGLSSVTKYDKVIKVNFSSNDTAIGVRFQGTETGYATGVATFRLPTIPDKLKALNETFGNSTSLKNDLIYRQVVESAKASARNMTVEEHYTGGAGEMSGSFRDQLEYGIIVTDRVEEYKPRQNKDGEMVNTLIIETVPRLDKEGNMIRNNNPLEKYGIIVEDASIQDVDYEKKVDERLDAQKAMASTERLATQKLKTAQQEAKTAQAEGEKQIAIATALAEKEKLQAEYQAEKEASVAKIEAEREKMKALIEAEKKVAVAEQQKLEQIALLERDKVIAEGLLVQAEARKTAGQNALDPKFVFEKELEAKVKMEQIKWEALSKIKLPTVYQGGNGGNGDTVETIGSIIELNSLTDVANKLKQAK